MASRNAHLATGWAAGLIAAALVAHVDAGRPSWFSCALGFVAALAGSTAPDWLELAWWSRSRRLWLPHRTLTHWGVGWIVLLLASWHALDAHPLAAAAFGFAIGGIVHLLADWPNPMGVPWLWRRHSLNWWRSGRCDALVVGAAWIAAFAVADRVWFHQGLTHLARLAAHSFG